MIMKFSDFLINKFGEWNSAQDEEKTLKDFSLYLEIDVRLALIFIVRIFKWIS